MAKVNKNQPPAAVSSLESMMQQLAAPAATNQEAPVVTNASPAVLVEIPLADNFPPSQFIVHVDTHFTLEQSTIIRRIANQLDRQQACLKNGQRVLTANSAMKWLLEQIADAAA